MVQAGVPKSKGQSYCLQSLANLTLGVREPAEGGSCPGNSVTSGTDCLTFTPSVWASYKKGVEPPVKESKDGVGIAKTAV